MGARVFVGIVREGEITNAASGVLYLGINDNSVSGNSGIWNVKIKLGGLP